LDFSLWINYQKPYEFNPPHCHDGVLSFVMYASIPEEIRSEYLDSHSPHAKMRGLIQFSSERTNEVFNFNPQTNDIFIFESTHKHEVFPFYSDNTRVSVAGNIFGWAE
jgi:hypothetical protein